MILERDGRFYHDEHDVEVSISNDNTKHLKVCKVKLRGDVANMEGAAALLKKADELYKEAVGN